MKTAIVTGAYGYIGTVLSKVLKSEGYHVIGIDTDPAATDDWLFRGNRTKYCDQFLVDSFASDAGLHALSEYPNATVFHLAANSLLGPSAYEPLTYFENNTANTLRLLQHLRPTNRLVFASTAAVYAVTEVQPIKESSRIGPPNNYGLSKLWCEQMIDAYHELGHIKASSFRFFNVIGSDGDVGQQLGTPHLIPQLCRAASTGTPFQLYSADYPTQDGTCVRDYFSVVDVARALIHADKYMEALRKDSCHLKFNLGTQSGFSVNEIITAFEEVIDGPINVETVGRRVGDPPLLVADPSKFIKKTNFEYKHSESLRDMIRGAWEYYNEQHSIRGKRDLRQVQRRNGTDEKDDSV